MELLAEGLKAKAWDLGAMGPGSDVLWWLTSAPSLVLPAHPRPPLSLGSPLPCHHHPLTLNLKP